MRGSAYLRPRHILLTGRQLRGLGESPGDASGERRTRGFLSFPSFELKWVFSGQSRCEGPA